jgi:hypothetical protein
MFLIEGVAVMSSTANPSFYNEQNRSSYILTLNEAHSVLSKTKQLKHRVNVVVKYLAHFIEDVARASNLIIKEIERGLLSRAEPNGLEEYA